MEPATIGYMERERCDARRRDGQRCGAPAVKGATVCRRHGANAKVRRNADMLVRLREFHASLPFLQAWVGSLTAEYERESSRRDGADAPRKCHAKRKDGRPCGCWAIRGGFVCRMHGGAAPQVRAKARTRVLAAEIHREMAASGT